MSEINLLEILCCPMCRADLEVEVYSGTENTINTGLLLCPACGSRYPIEDALIYFLPEANTLKEEGRPIWSLPTFDNTYKRFGYYESSYAWRERKGIPKVITDYDYPKVKGRLLNWLKPKNGDLILDVGTGSGYFIFEMMRKYPDVRATFVGLDVSKEHVQWLAYRKRKENKRNIIAVVGDAMRLPFKDGIFRMATCTEVLEHIFEPGKAISEIARVLRKREGRLLLSTPSKLGWSFWNRMLYFPRRLLKKKNSLVPYDYPLHPARLIHELEARNLAINRFELNVILPPQSLFSSKLPYHMPKFLIPTVLSICGQLERRGARWLKGFALHMLIEASNAYMKATFGEEKSAATSLNN